MKTDRFKATFEKVHAWGRTNPVLAARIQTAWQNIARKSETYTAFMDHVVSVVQRRTVHLDPRERIELTAHRAFALGVMVGLAMASDNPVPRTRFETGET